MTGLNWAVALWCGVSAFITMSAWTHAGIAGWTLVPRTALAIGLVALFGLGLVLIAAWWVA